MGPDLASDARRTELLLDAALAVAVFAASIGELVGGTDLDGHTGDVRAATVLLAALSSLPLVARRVAPLAVFVVTALASTALHGISEPAGPPVGPTLALYFVGLAGAESRARARLVLGLVAALLIAHLSAVGLADDRFPGAELVFGVLVWGGALLAGDRARLRRERLAELEERALRAEREADRERRLAAAEERTRIARDLHDSAGHAINVILVHAGLGRLRSEATSEGAREFEIIEQVARETIGEIDQLVGNLREDRAGGGGVDPPPGLAALPGLVARQRRAGLGVATAEHGNRRPLPAAVDRGAYRILQEALTNAARHGAGSARVDVAFEPDALALTITNPLPNGDRPARADGGGHGLVGMHERAAILGGTLEAAARDGHFRVRARLPLVEHQR